MKETETQKAIEVDDLQNQVRDHIKSHDLFDWHEALTEEEMSYLENLMLTFAPMFSPGSIGFAKTVQPYIAKADEEKEKEIERLKVELEGMYANNKEGWTKMEVFEKETVRLKIVIEGLFREYGSRRMSQPVLEQSWQQFKTENQL